MLRWGLIPFWAKDAKTAYKTINALGPDGRHGAIVPRGLEITSLPNSTSGFYEWVKTPEGKQPYLIGFRDGRLFNFGGLWESWKDPASGEMVESYSIVTGQPNAIAAKIHNRMPVIIDPPDFDRWLAAAEPPADLLRTHPATGMVAYSVSTAVNSPKYDQPELIEPVAG